MCYNYLTYNADHYPFGMALVGRSWNGEDYRYGFNGQEKTPELNPSHTTALFWEYDGRLGRRWNIDPKPNPSISYYVTFANNPIWFSDHLGDTTSVNLFDKEDKAIFHDAANTAVKKQVNDGVFLVYAHGNSRAIQYTDKERDVREFAATSEEFNAVMSERCPEYKQALKDGKAIILKLYSCNVAAEEFVTPGGNVIKEEYTIAEKIADGLPDGSIVIAPDGYVAVGKINGKTVVKGIIQTTEAQPENTHNGGFITIQKNQKHIAKQKMSYDRTTKVTTKGSKEQLEDE